MKALGRISLVTLVIGLLVAVALAPAASLSSVAVAKASGAMESDIEALEAGNIPGVTTVRDSQGNNMAYLFNQRRHPVEPDQISQNMKDAIVSIEDHRFYEHEGVDIQGNFRALATNLLAGDVSQGASTLNQQYVKNYLLLVDAETDEERQAATEQSIPRKLREMRMAAEIDRTLSKDEILANYLNLVPFGNHAYGIEAAARTYFGVGANELTLPQSAMLAGMVQSSEYLNPYTNTEEVLKRRATVLQSMVANGYISQAEADEANTDSLGVLDSPNNLPNGCIGAGDRGFFCDYVLQYLDERGISTEVLSRGGYTIDTTLNPVVQDRAKESVNAQTSSDAAGVASVMNVVRPSETDRDVLAMVSSRTYGLDLDQNETLLPQPYSMVGNGAGSVFKVFTAAAAVEAGYGIKNMLDVPTRYDAEGLGYGGADNCPANRYCVENAGTYKPRMTFEEALAHSPNTTFIQLEEQVGIEATVDMAVKLGLRSYTDEGSFNEEYSLADYAKEAPMGSFTLGPTAVNPLELSNVGATLASHGTWCEPDPIDKITDRNGNEVYVESTPCERVMNGGAADALANAMTEDAKIGTAEDAANQMGWNGEIAAKTGTTESNQSAAFLGFNSGLAAAPYIYNDGTNTSPLCTSPVRQCGSGTLFGGTEPARTFFGMATQLESATQGTIPSYDRAYDRGKSSGLLESLRGRTESAARQSLESEGYKVRVISVPDAQASGTVVRALTGSDGLADGAEITLQISDGSGFTAPSSNDSGGDSSGDGGNTSGNNGGGNSRGNGNSNPPPLISQEDIDNFTDELRRTFGLN
ncbi:transglycosylase domain-containing protein [Corynebacterium ammoniagenes]|uniref:transglycosylase domain-containing protein n=1 Tax=Corynebacterium ammoniagenes TaxID=1697 RepID=UPI0035A2227C